MLTVIQFEERVPLAYFGTLLDEWAIPRQILRLDRGAPLPPADGGALLVLGGNMGVHDEALYPYLAPLKQWLRQVVAAAAPVLGICLGGQLLAEVLGGTVQARSRGEKGLQTVQLSPAGRRDPLFAQLPATFQAFQWHNDSFDPPASAAALASSADCPGQAFRLGNAWGLQFHPEVDAPLVRAWSDRSGVKPGFTEAFTAAAEPHQQMARQLLRNFLRQAGLCR